MNRQSNAEIDWVETPDSSNIAAFGYHHARSVLIIDYKNRQGQTTSTYEYDNVPPETFEAMKTAPSVGKYVVANVKNVFTATQSNAYGFDHTQPTGQ